MCGRKPNCQMADTAPHVWPPASRARFGTSAVGLLPALLLGEVFGNGLFSQMSAEQIELDKEALGRTRG